MLHPLLHTISRPPVLADMTPLTPLPGDLLSNLRVSCRLEPDGNGTRLFEQSGFDLSQPWGDAARRGAEAGWERMYEGLARVLEGLAAHG